MNFWIASYPKSGNTWFRAFLANLLDEDTGGPANINRLQLCANFDSRDLFDDLLGWETSDLPGHLVHNLRIAAQESVRGPARRYFKTHDAYAHPQTHAQLFSASATEAAIYIIRNPLDVAVSFANHLGTDIDTAAALMGRDNAHLNVPSQLPQPLGTWSWHVNSWTTAKDLNFQVLRYEDMLVNPFEVFAEACRFAKLEVTASEIRRALDRSRFDVLREQETTLGFVERPPKCSTFFRSGQAGSWRTHLSSSQVQSILNCHGDTMLRFGYLTPNRSLTP